MAKATIKEAHTRAFTEAPKRDMDMTELTPSPTKLNEVKGKRLITMNMDREALTATGRIFKCPLHCGLWCSGHTDRFYTQIHRTGNALSCATIFYKKSFGTFDNKLCQCYEANNFERSLHTKHKLVG